MCSERRMHGSSGAGRGQPRLATLLEIFAANRADQPFDERMRNRDVGNRLDPVDFEYTKVRKQAVETKERIVVGTDVFR